MRTYIIKRIRQRGPYILLILYISSEVRHLAAIVFIDNIYILVKGNSKLEVQENLQDTDMTWAGSLKATGFTLIPEKLFWQTVNFDLERGGVNGNIGGKFYSWTGTN